MTAENQRKKTYLLQYIELKRDCDRLQRKIAEIRIAKLSPGAMASDGMPHGSDLSDLSGYAAKLDDLERKLVCKLELKTAAYCRISDRIDCMESEDDKTNDERLKNVLRMKYLQDWSFERIAVEYDKDWRTIVRWHGQALQIF